MSTPGDSLETRTEVLQRLFPRLSFAEAFTLAHGHPQERDVSAPVYPGDVLCRCGHPRAVHSWIEYIEDWECCCTPGCGCTLFAETETPVTAQELADQINELEKKRRELLDTPCECGHRYGIHFQYSGCGGAGQITPNSATNCPCRGFSLRAIGDRA